MSNDAQSNITGNMIGQGGGAIAAPNHVHLGSLMFTSVLIIIIAVIFAVNIKKRR